MFGWSITEILLGLALNIASTALIFIGLRSWRLGSINFRKAWVSFVVQRGRDLIEARETPIITVAKMVSRVAYLGFGGTIIIIGLLAVILTGVMEPLKGDWVSLVMAAFLIGLGNAITISALMEIGFLLRALTDAGTIQTEVAAQLQRLRK